MQLTVLGCGGAWPDAGQACSACLVEHDGFRLLVDLGYAIVPRLLERVTAAQVDAVPGTRGMTRRSARVRDPLRSEQSICPSTSGVPPATISMHNGGYTRVAPIRAGYRVSPDSGTDFAPSADSVRKPELGGRMRNALRSQRYAWPRPTGSGDLLRQRRLGSPLSWQSVTVGRYRRIEHLGG
jgi:hypothetical protein